MWQVITGRQKSNFSGKFKLKTRYLGFITKVL